MKCDIYAFYFYLTGAYLPIFNSACHLYHPINRMFNKKKRGGVKTFNPLAISIPNLQIQSYN